MLHQCDEWERSESTGPLATLRASSSLALNNRAELALGGLRSAKPRLGEPRGNGSLRRREPYPRGVGATGTPRREPVQPRDGRRGIFTLLRRPGDERRDLGVQGVHTRIGVRPAISEPRGLELLEEWLDLGAAEQRRAGGNQQTN